MRESFYGRDAWSPLARALRAFIEGDREARLNVYADEGEADPMNVSIFFRSPEEFGEGDRKAVSLARGRVLDIGAGVGSITLALQAQGMEVAALEVIPDAVKIMKERGVLDARQGRMEDLTKDGSYDTLLLLMNGTALAGTLSSVPEFLRQLEGLLAPGGQILIDSTDLGIPLEDAEELTKGTRKADHQPADRDYPGEFQYQLEFMGQRGAPFPQLFLDSSTFSAAAETEGFQMKVVWRCEDGGYLARLTRLSES